LFSPLGTRARLSYFFFCSRLSPHENVLRSVGYTRQNPKRTSKRYVFVRCGVSSRPVHGVRQSITTVCCPIDDPCEGGQNVVLTYRTNGFYVGGCFGRAVEQNWRCYAKTVRRTDLGFVHEPVATVYYGRRLPLLARRSVRSNLRPALIIRET